MSRRLNHMDPRRWVPAECRAILDVGCNVGALLQAVGERFPKARLAGCDVNRAAVEAARSRVPGAELHVCGSEELPFPDGTFDAVTCIEVFEHIPPALWRASMQEMRRVLAPGGRLVLRTPHAGVFQWLDSNNLRFRMPGLYRAVIGVGRRDAGYAERATGVEWHYHFTRPELLDLAGPGWEVERTCYGGLVLFPLVDLLCWPFYRLGRPHHPIRRTLEQVSEVEFGIDFGPHSAGILLVLRKA